VRTYLGLGRCKRFYQNMPFHPVTSRTPALAPLYWGCCRNRRQRVGFLSISISATATLYFVSKGGVLAKKPIILSGEVLPARVRSISKPRSNSARAAKIRKISLPPGVMVLISSVSDRKCRARWGNPSSMLMRSRIAHCRHGPWRRRQVRGPHNNQSNSVKISRPAYSRRSRIARFRDAHLPPGAGALARAADNLSLHSLDQL
jgi:hypothetical protein